ncbi:unnamed protein product (macronuclear) [Paramecium tetraurelia]|uniref:ELYS-like domain-containing protein n=1 Tax=Paramecium tetraurelia TaxID=5888 RepID=A0BMS4_PARTE|nr:uncharacterized protein GSPATT00030477001 [Paramecium tetraurelia]CAK59841.1 unnamed protein product [Paramecium tetraurelia]|eukprot:XP_001427239.1 hypothetical protein (macronuclear) [Paramecium tetraurelia strain d4-2]
MDQEIPQNNLQHEWNFNLSKAEEHALLSNQDHYFFDMNFMILPDVLDKIAIQLNINPEVISSQQYQKERQKLLFTMLKYEIGLDILIKLVYRRDQSPLNGYYYLKTLDDVAYVIYNMQTELLNLMIEQNLCLQQISNRIVKLFNSVLNRKKKEVKQLSLSHIVQKDLEILKQKFSRINDINCVLRHQEYYIHNWRMIYDFLNAPQYKLLKKVILCKIELQQMLKEKSEKQLLRLMSQLTIYQQELIITYIQFSQLSQEQEIQESEMVRGKYAQLYKALFLMDTDQEKQLPNIVKLMMLYYFEIENWKLLVIEELMELHQEQNAYELLLASKINWSSLSNSDIIIKLLIASKRSLQAYVYVTELKEEQALKYFIKQMIDQNDILKLLQIEFTPEQDNIVNEIIKNLAEKEVLIEFVKKLLRAKKYFQAIEFYKKLHQTHFQLDLERIEELIKKGICQLPEIEENYYLVRMEGKQLTEDELLIEAILDNQEKINEEQHNFEPRNIQYFVEQPIVDYERVINCCGWIRQSHLGIIF